MVHARPRRFAQLLAICLLCLSSRSAIAWNAPGHMIITLVAYDLMPPAAKEQALALLHAHPRFADHFERAQRRAVAEGTDAQKEQWIFAYASTWSDVVRSASGGVTREDVDAYNRTWWHFVNHPVYLNEAEEKLLAPTITVNLRRDPPEGLDDPNMNVIQAIKNSSRIVADKNAAPALRSIHLCWLLHLIGDSHQPLHASTLFTTRRFPEDDHGGNYLHIEHEYPLHAFWDDAISTDEPYPTVRLLAANLAKNAELAAAGQKATSQLDPGAWIDEGHELAKKYAYTPEILQKIAAREGHTHLGDLKPSPQYFADAETLCERQAVIAAHRMAKLLEQLLK